MKKLFGKSNGEEHNFWMSYTDLLSGFLIVFIIATIVYQKANNKYKDFNKQLEQRGITIDQANEMLTDYLATGNMVEINKEFTNVFDGVDSVVLLPDKGVIRFYPYCDKELFENNRDDLKPNLEIRLKKVGKAFVRKAMELQNDGNEIEIRIEGHADSKPLDLPYRDSFVNNLLLSSKRAIAVYNCLMEECGLTEKEKAFVKKNVVAVGYSSARPINYNNEEDGKEDMDKSRRIELRIISKQKYHE